MRALRLGGHSLGALAATAVLTMSLVAVDAEAQTAGLEGGLAVPTGDTGDGHDLGWFVGGHAGIGLPVPAITLAVEAIGDFASLPIADTELASKAWRLGAGIRAGLPIPYVPDAFVHLGYGNVSVDVDTELGSIGVDSNGFTWDVGLASNLLSLPLISLGVSVAYKSISLESDSFTFLTLGLHGELGF